MKKILTISMLALAATWAEATLQPFYQVNSGIFDATTSGTLTLGGVTQTRPGGGDASGPGQAFYGNVAAPISAQVVAAAVTLNVSGGFDGTLYAYLIAPDGTLRVLVNAPANLTGQGVDVTLSSAAYAGYTAPSSSLGGGVGTQDPGNTITPYTGSTPPFIQTYDDSANNGGLLTGTYQPYESLVYQTPSSAQFPGSPTGPYANGTWTLFVADLQQGDAPLTVNSWSLSLTVVPEPVDLALGLFAAMLLAYAGVKHFWKPRPAAAATVED